MKPKPLTQYGIFFNRNHPELNYGETGYLLGTQFFPDAERPDASSKNGFLISKNDLHTTEMTYINGLESKTKY